MKPSTRTAKVWTEPYVRHAFRMECAIFVINIIALVFGIAASVLDAKGVRAERAADQANASSSSPGSDYNYNGDYYYDGYDDAYYSDQITGDYVASLIPPLVTLAISILDFVLYFTLCLHPIYTLVLSIFWIAGWIVSFIFIIGFHHYGSDIFGDLGVESVQEAFFGITFCAYFAYFIISAVGVDHFRKSQWKDMLESVRQAPSQPATSEATPAAPVNGQGV